MSCQRKMLPESLAHGQLCFRIAVRCLQGFKGYTRALMCREQISGLLGGSFSRKLCQACEADLASSHSLHSVNSSSFRLLVQTGLLSQPWDSHVFHHRSFRTHMWEVGRAYTMDGIVSPSKSVRWRPNPQCVFGDGALKEVMKVKWGHRGRS